MDPVAITDFAREGIWVLLIVASPMLLTALIVGFVVSLVQALTQIQETTLAFVPKLVAMLLIMMLAMPYMLQSLQSYGQRMFDQIAATE